MWFQARLQARDTRVLQSACNDNHQSFTSIHSVMEEDHVDSDLLRESAIGFRQDTDGGSRLEIKYLKPMASFSS